MNKVISLITIFWCASIAVLHLTPSFRNQWEKIIKENDRMHIGVGIFVLLLGLVNFFLLLTFY